MRGLPRRVRTFALTLCKMEAGAAVGAGVAYWNGETCDLTCVFKGSFWLLRGGQTGAELLGRDTI